MSRLGGTMHQIRVKGFGVAFPGNKFNNADVELYIGIVKSDSADVKLDGATVKSDGGIVKSNSATVKSNGATVKFDNGIVKFNIGNVKFDGAIVGLIFCNKAVWGVRFQYWDEVFGVMSLVVTNIIKASEQNNVADDFFNGLSRRRLSYPVLFRACTYY